MAPILVKVFVYLEAYPDLDVRIHALDLSGLEGRYNTSFKGVRGKQIHTSPFFLKLFLSFIIHFTVMNYFVLDCRAKFQSYTKA